MYAQKLVRLFFKKTMTSETPALKKPVQATYNAVARVVEEEGVPVRDLIVSDVFK